MRTFFLFLSCCLLVACNTTKSNQDQVVELTNPILPGYFADPSIVQYEGKFYLYVTADPWGTEFLSCWVSDDFQNWTFHKLNWPTKAACTSPLSNTNNVWAPSVVRKGDLFYMYVSVGSEVWCGKATHPLGPWENILVDKPMIAYDTTRFYHVIDAEAFIDEDGKSYLYWGSGWDWINGHCYAAELNEDMASFKGTPVEVTPTRYFEGPLMVKHQGKYYLTYSEGKTIDDTYEVRYAVGEHPLGPFKEASNSPILKTNDELDVYGPGHHTVFSLGGKSYILYHKHRLPFVTGTAMRQTCINELTFNEEASEINTVIPYNTQLFPNLNQTQRTAILPMSIIASSEQAPHTAAHAVDNHFGTRWEANETDTEASITALFDSGTSLKTMEIRFEYAWKTYFITIESSKDGVQWDTVADYSEQGITGSPVVVDINKSCQFIRISFSKWDSENKPAIWDIYFY